LRSEVANHGVARSKEGRIVGVAKEAAAEITHVILAVTISETGSRDGKLLCEKSLLRGRAA
jgi:hypothetical protein